MSAARSRASESRNTSRLALIGAAGQETDPSSAMTDRGNLPTEPRPGRGTNPLGGTSSSAPDRTPVCSAAGSMIATRRSSAPVAPRFATFDEHHRHDGEVSVGLAGEDDLAVRPSWPRRTRGLAAGESGSGRTCPGSAAPCSPPGWSNRWPATGVCAGSRHRRGRPLTRHQQAGISLAYWWRRTGAAGVPAPLLRARVGWVAERADEVWFYANARNAVSLALHAAIGLEEVTRDFSVPGVSFEGGVGVLGRLRLRPVTLG